MSKEILKFDYEDLLSIKFALCKSVDYKTNLIKDTTYCEKYRDKIAQLHHDINHETKLITTVNLKIFEMKDKYNIK